MSRPPSTWLATQIEIRDVVTQLDGRGLGIGDLNALEKENEKASDAGMTGRDEHV